MKILLSPSTHCKDKKRLKRETEPNLQLKPAYKPARIPQRILVLKERQTAQATRVKSQGRSLVDLQSARTNPGCIIPCATRILVLWLCRVCRLCSPFPGSGRLHVG